MNTNGPILNYLQRAIQMVIAEFVQFGFISDSSESLPLLFDGIERVMNHARKEEFFLKTTTWEIYRQFNYLPWLTEGFAFIERINEDLRGQAFIRYLLNSKRFEMFYTEFRESELVDEYYEANCIFNPEDDHQIFHHQLLSLQSIDFRLSLDPTRKATTTRYNGALNFNSHPTPSNLSESPAFSLLHNKPVPKPAPRTQEPLPPLSQPKQIPEPKYQPQFLSQPVQQPHYQPAQPQPVPQQLNQPQYLAQPTQPAQPQVAPQQYLPQSLALPTQPAANPIEKPVHQEAFLNKSQEISPSPPVLAKPQPQLTPSPQLDLAPRQADKPAPAATPSGGGLVFARRGRQQPAQQATETPKPAPVPQEKPSLSIPLSSTPPAQEQRQTPPLQQAPIHTQQPPRPEFFNPPVAPVSGGPATGFSLNPQNTPPQTHTPPVLLQPAAQQPVHRPPLLTPSLPDEPQQPARPPQPSQPPPSETHVQASLSTQAQQPWDAHAEGDIRAEESTEIQKPTSQKRKKAKRRVATIEPWSQSSSPTKTAPVENIN